GFIGFWIRASLVGETLSVTDTIYLTLQLISLESGSVTAPIPWQLQVSRFLTPIIAAYAAVVALAMLFKERLDLFRLRFWENHIVICGFGRRGLLLAKAFREQGRRVVTIERDPHESHIEHCRDLGIVGFVGDARARASLLQARVPRARYLIAVCNDAVNAEIALRARELVEERERGTLTCFVDIVDLELCRMLREKEIVSHKGAGFRLEFCNVFELGARALLEEYSPFDPVVNDHTTQPHVVIVGVGRFGESLILHAARDWRRIRQDEHSRLRISLIDRTANARLELLRLRHPKLERICDFSIHEMETQSPDFQKGDFLYEPEGLCDISLVYVCLDDDSASLSAALALHRQLKKCDRKIPIVVRMTEGGGLAAMVPEGDISGEFDNVHVFRLLDQTCRPEVLCMGINEIIARAIHDDYVEKERKKGQTIETNPSMVPWEELREDEKENNRDQAEHLAKRLETSGYRIMALTDWDAENFVFPPEEVEEMARMEHERWCTRKRGAGFTYAPGTKADKTDPDLVPWDELGPASREKYRNIVREAPRFFAEAGFQVEKVATPKRAEKQ
ncbi:MAG: NAD-binding protein, partial [Candidatus Hydrogenedentota bacterium]